MDWVKLLAKFGIIYFCIMGLQGCSIPMSEIGKQAFETSYVQLECPYPKEPTPKNSNNKVAEESRAELDESDEEALKRIISTGTIQSFQNFKESYPKSKYIQEVSDWTQWLEKWKIGVLITINESNLPLEIDRMKHNLCDKLGPLLERYRGQVSFLRNPGEAKSTKISTLLEIRHFDYGTNPNRTGRIAGATILFGPLGALAQHRLEPPNIKINNWATTITDLSSSELEYERRETFQNFGEIFIKYNLSEELRKVVVWAWIAQREEAPLGFLKIIFNDEDPYFRSKIIKALGNISKPPIEFLTDALNDRDSSVRSEAAYVLGKIKDTKGVDPLIAALKDGNLNVRWRAAEALWDITGKNFGENPVKWQEWWDKNKAK